MIWIVRCSLRTYLSYPLSSSPLHTAPELVQDEKVLSIFTPPASAEALSGLTGSILMFHLKGKKAFSIDLPFPPFKVTNTPDFSVLSCLNSLWGEKDFLWCLNLPRVYISSPWMHWGLLILPQSAYAKRSFNLFLPSFAQRRGGLLLFPQNARGRWGLFTLLVPPIAERRWGL